MGPSTAPFQRLKTRTIVAPDGATIDFERDRYRPLHSGTRGSVTARDLWPVDHVIERSDVLRPAILILQIVRMFPNIQPENGLVARHQSRHQRTVLITRIFHDQAALLVDAKPRPAAAKTRQCRLRERF